MQTVPYKKIRDGAAKMLGLGLTEGNENIYRQLAESITLRTAEGWTREWWPDWTLTEERTAVDGVISFHQSDETVIDRIKSVTRRDPSLYPDKAWAVNYRRINDGIVLGTGEPTTVFITFQTVPPQFTSDKWSATVTYAVGDCVYLATTGECYLALAASTNVSPETDAAKWAVQEFPALLAPFVKRAAVADLTNTQKQKNAARSELDLAYADLERAVSQTFSETGLYHTVEVSGYGAN